MSVSLKVAIELLLLCIILPVVGVGDGVGLILRELLVRQNIYVCSARWVSSL